MLAKLEFKRSLNGKGEPQYVISGWTGISTKDELPDKYLDSRPSFFLSKNPVRGNEVINVVRKAGRQGTYELGDILTYEEHGMFISNLKMAGENLTRINKEIKKLTRKWTDKKFVVEI